MKNIQSWTVFSREAVFIESNTRVKLKRNVIKSKKRILNILLDVWSSYNSYNISFKGLHIKYVRGGVGGFLWGA